MPNPGHFKGSCAAVPRHCSLHFLILLFYVKPLVRNYYYFYMSDLMNAVYNLICIIVKYVPLTSGADNCPNFLPQIHEENIEIFFKFKD